MAAAATPPPDALRDLVLDLVSYEVTRRLRQELPGSPLLAERLAAVRATDLDVVQAALELVDTVLAG